MKVIWVLENIKGTLDFYSKLNTLILITSIKQWKKYHPEDNCILYCDKLTKKLFDKSNISNLWDEIIVYKPEYNLKKEVFWASCKLEVLSKQNEPVIIVDNDTHIFCPIKDYLEKDTLYVHNRELGKGYYPTAIDEHIRKLSIKERWKPKAVNVSFLYLPDYKFTQKYSNLSLKIMKELTDMDVPHSQYLIFSEQLVLNHLLEKDNIKFKSLISEYWNCDTWDWDETHNKGLWSIKESGQYVKHYGPEKSWIKREAGEKIYKRNIKNLENNIKSLNLDLSFIVKK